MRAADSFLEPKLSIKMANFFDKLYSSVSIGGFMQTIVSE